MNYQNTDITIAQGISSAVEVQQEGQTKSQVWYDPANMYFAETLEKATWIGIGMMLFFGVLYLFGMNTYVDANSVVANWGEPARNFWHTLKGMEPNGYAWFLSEIGTMDSLSLIGIVLLALAPLVAVFTALIKATERASLILLSILSLEFIVAIVRPLYTSAGGH